MNDVEKNESAEKDILRIEQELFNAIREKDARRFGLFLADDFLYRTHEGKELGKEEFLRGIAAMPVEISSVRGEHQRVRVYGDIAVLTGVQRAEWRQGDAAAGVNSVAFTDVFERRDGRWLLVLAYGVELLS